MSFFQMEPDSKKGKKEQKRSKRAFVNAAKHESCFA